MTKHRGAPARHFAWRILREIDCGRSLQELDLQCQLDQSSLEFQDKRLAERLIKGTLEKRLVVDAALDPFLKGGIKKQSLAMRSVLRLGAYQLMFLDKVTASAAVNQTVELAKKVTNKFGGNLTNAVLRKIAASSTDIVSGTVAVETSSARSMPLPELAILLNHPEWLVARWIDQIGLEETLALCESNNSRAVTTIRINTLKTTVTELIEEFLSDGLVVEPSRWLPNCFRVLAFSSNKRLTELRAFQKGYFSIQDESSALVVNALGIRPNEHVLDLCAAPGGKTVYLAEQMLNTGQITAIDSSESRLAKVEENCARLEVTNVVTIHADGITYKSDILYDKVLVDAPCSGLGTVGRKKDLRWLRREDTFDQLRPAQLSLLTNAANLVKVAGLIVYSTCSIDRAENEEVVDAFLAAQPNFSRLPICELSRELLNERGELRTWPQRHGIGGAFASVLVKNY